MNNGREPSMLYNLLQDGKDGSLSSRRVVTFCAFVLCAIAFIANMFFGITIEKFIFDSMSYIAIAGLGATVAEKFAGNSSNNTYMNEQQYYNNYQQPTPYQQNNYRNQNRYVRGQPIPQQNDPLI